MIFTFPTSLFPPHSHHLILTTSFLPLYSSHFNLTTAPQPGRIADMVKSSQSSSKKSGKPQRSKKTVMPPAGALLQSTITSFVAVSKPSSSRSSGPSGLSIKTAIEVDDFNEEPQGKKPPQKAGKALPRLVWGLEIWQMVVEKADPGLLPTIAKVSKTLSKLVRERGELSSPSGARNEELTGEPNLSQVSGTCFPS